MMGLNRRNTVWLTVLAVLIGIVLVSGNVAPAVQLFLLGVFALAAVASILNPALRTSLVQTLQQHSPLNRVRMSPQAREAMERAQSRGGYYASSDLAMIDLGLIASQSGRDGMVMRRTRSISKDDDGVRPFITLQVPAHEADRNANIRYEIIDQNGREQYIHDMRVYLRDGEMNILAENHLPLMENPMIEGMGDWDLRVFIDDMLVGIHNFTLTPSYEDRRNRLNRDRGGQYYITENEGEYESRAPQDEEVPMSLEELLRNQSQRSDQN